MAEPIYNAANDCDGNFFVEGPAPGGQCSYHGGFLYPESRLISSTEASKMAVMMNIAYREGYEKAQSDIRNSLGIKNKY